ncbi:MAG TPA: hypothetical protein VLC92_20015 [Rhodocyclaceae bacterium]|nr:hypothetical protein [Rhodocyclaceae bacterium]
MTPLHSQSRLAPAPRLHTPSSALALLGLVIGCILLAAAVWLGTALRSDLTGIQTSTHPLQLVDAERALVFDANATTGDVRVLSVRSGVSEVARLRERNRHDVTAITLDAQRKVLTVISGDARYQYDAHSFRLLEHSPLLAANGTRERDMQGDM